MSGGFESPTRDQINSRVQHAYVLHLINSIMYYIIYKITNTLNGKYYIGKHQTTDLNDGYLGSGKLLKRAIEKYGVEHFTKEILHIFDNEVEMNAKEKELVVICEESYNLCPGGRGGFGYINANLDLTEIRIKNLEKSRTPEKIKEL